MEVDALVLGRPEVDLLGLFRGGVVDDQVELLARLGADEQFEKGQEFCMAVALVAGAGNPAGGDLQGRKQTGDAAALVVVGMSRPSAASSAQRLATVEGM
ncbi:MAG: hypothetical protein JF886_10175 [Candidatus Dormibacteraeota bacterium]|uniref:Uncharacterized protein n=1 Tax=Candidatus Aeolococcus gillhamiae TaxID=3127015 RepID=A0A934JWA0_9BACT|nr:hypothetical protein [Candidatus Dormibacteraeota bacterium]MBJ7606134.1 hypothetical protein [Candidatus Dormibacteraeota bacterium]